MIEVTKPRAIALGYFDGVHLGHRALMQRAVERAKQIGGTSAVFTFDVHPDSVVMGRQVPLLTANAYRTEEIKKLGGVDEVIFGHFDHEMQHMDWRDFIHKLLIGRFNAGWIISGRNNRFGYKGQGNAEGMAIECEKAGIGYDCIEDVKIDGIVVSSTYIRQLISQGDMEGAAKFLGHPVYGFRYCGARTACWHKRAAGADGQSASADRNGAAAVRCVRNPRSGGRTELYRSDQYRCKADIFRRRCTRPSSRICSTSRAICTAR